MADDADEPRAEVRTFLIADVRGYTRFTQTRGDEAAAELAAKFASIVQDVVSARDGVLLELRGDEALVVFGSPRQAVRCALELQARFVEETLADPRVPLGVGIGIDSGEAIPVRGGYRGAALNLAARLCSSAAAGQVLASTEVTHLARRIDGIRYVDRGRTQFKGIDEPTQVVRVVPEGRDPVTDPAFAFAVNPPDLMAVARRRRDRQRRLIVTMVAALVVLADIAVVVDRSTREKPLDRIGTNAVGRVSLGGGTLHGRVAVGDGPGPIASGAGSVWVGNVVDDTVSRIDLADPGFGTNTVEVGHEPSGIAVGGGGVWVANAADRSVSLINPEAAKEVKRIEVGTAPHAIGYGYGRIWVANALDDTVSVIDTQRAAVVATIPVGANPSGVAVGFGSVWVTDSGSGLVSRIDPRTNMVVAAVTVGNSPESVVAYGDGVWVTNIFDDTVSRIDPRTNSVVGTLRVGSEPDGIAGGGGAVWVANGNDDTVSRIDPKRGHVTKTIPVGNSPRALSVAGGDLWLTASGSAAEHGHGTLRVVARDGDTQSLDPAIAYAKFGWNLLSVVNDGLVTFRRTAGPTGGQIVPDLAVRLPAVSDQGRTYAFQLRRGIRYSDGTPVRASDFRSSLERTLRLGQSPYLRNLVGADSCRHPVRCDLSQGVVTDDATGTITLHLSKPDADTLAQLALPFASFLPSDTPADDVGFGPHPATGPYRIQAGTPSHVRLDRNPYFHPWSAVAQPAGYPDVIDVTFRRGPEGDEDSNMVAVARGDYDWTPDFTPGATVEKLLRTKTTQLHRYTTNDIDYVTLNTREAPFNDVRVRRAVNLAVDRAAAVELFGGDTRAAATCQVLPPILYGYRPYCPYTRGAKDTGTWAGPDLAAARELIRRAGAVGARARVFARPSAPEASELAVRTMRRIGLDAVLVGGDFFGTGDRAEERYFEYIGQPQNHVAAASIGWFADFPEPSNMFLPLLRCDAITLEEPVNINAGLFCDHGIDAAMDRAARLQERDPAAGAVAWAEVDRRVVDLAPWLFLATHRGYDVVSQRLGNYQHNPQYGMLIDQVWVH